MTDMRTRGSHSTASTVHVWTVEINGVGTKVIAHMSQDMHLNPPLTDPAKVYKKKVSWWNTRTHETRSEGINGIEKFLGRDLTEAEYARMTVTIDTTATGIDTTVNVWLD